MIIKNAFETALLRQRGTGDKLGQDGVTPS